MRSEVVIHATAFNKTKIEEASIKGERDQNPGTTEGSKHLAACLFRYGSPNQRSDSKREAKQRNK
jgi:hypothetical protein